MRQPRLTKEMLAQMPRERDVLSFDVATDTKGRAFLFKLALMNKTIERLLLMPALAFSIRSNALDTIKKFKWTDSPMDKESDFSAEVQADIALADWDGPFNDGKGSILGLEFHAFSDAFFIGFEFEQSVYKILRFRPALGLRLVHLIDRIEAAGGMIDAFRAAPPSGRVQ